MNKRTLKYVMRSIAAGMISRASAAARLEISERHVNRLMKEHGVARPPSEAAQLRAGRRLLAQARRVLRAQEVAAVLEGRRTLEQAARAGKCSVRTMYRWVAKAKKLSKKRKK